MNRVEQWPAEAYQQALELQTDGLMAVTHLALLRPPGGKACRGYVKHFIGQGTQRCLFNEWFSYHVMGALGIPQPRCAMMAAPVWGTLQLQWAFVSCEPSPVHHGTPKQIYNMASAEHCKALLARLLGCALLPALIAADQLLANTDRNLGNLVFTGRDTFVAIDHSNALHGPNWTLAQLQSTQHPARMMLLDFMHHVNPVLPPNTANAIVAAAEVMEQAYYEHQDELRAVLGCSGHAPSANAMDMTWWRCLKLAAWMRTALGVI
ncbi:hypothetical protein [Acidovorax sp.]|uniref:hypothetical protein n=1 Tax=Acidovorax sp. TaxID=1872122 RepID=UPI00258EE3D9|nr:hypothetical protein [Acidovorax sp.]